jgi:hypothetical protein
MDVDVPRQKFGGGAVRWAPLLVFLLSLALLLLLLLLSVCRGGGGE